MMMLEMKEHVRRLLGFLEDPHPGLMTWNEAIADELRALANVAPRSKEEKASMEPLAFLLTRIGSWTPARWDQHLRHEFGDERAQVAIDYLEKLCGAKEYGERRVKR